MSSRDLIASFPIVESDGLASNYFREFLRGLVGATPYRNEAADPYTLVIGDANSVIRLTATDADVTIPQESSVNFARGTEISLRFAGSGTHTLTTTGLTINGTVPSLTQHLEIKFRKVGADEWDVV